MSSVQIALLFFDLALILALSRVFGVAARRIGQPAVIGEIVLGILLGPTILHGAVPRVLFPVDIQHPLTALADVGVALFMFIVGLEIDHTLMRSQRVTAGGIALGATVLPYGLGLLCALWLAGEQRPAHRAGFVLFVATAMTITAFPVLARILEDHGLLRTTLGGVALASAAICDVVGWTLLAVAIGVAEAHGTSLWRVALVVPFVAVVVLAARPLLRRLLEDTSAVGGNSGGPSAGANSVGAGTSGASGGTVVDGGAGGTGGLVRALTVVFILLLGSAAFLEWAGLNFIFGAFLIGAIVPRGQGGVVAARIRVRVEQVGMHLLMPVFFVIAGLSVNLATLGFAGVGMLAVILLVAVAGKVGGTFVAARTLRIAPRHSLSLAVLMNTRGLTELVVLSTGVQLGILDHRTYSMAVVMALLTTAMTGPLLAALRRWGGTREEGIERVADEPVTS